MKVAIKSFAFHNGLPKDVDLWGGIYLFDCRLLPDPYWEEDLRDKSGCDKEVKDFFKTHEDEIRTFLGPIETVVRRVIDGSEETEWETIAVLFGCTGGRHRSVYCAERLAAGLRGLEDVEIEVEHVARTEWKKSVDNEE